MAPLRAEVGTARTTNSCFCRANPQRARSRARKARSNASRADRRIASRCSRSSCSMRWLRAGGLVCPTCRRSERQEMGPTLRRRLMTFAQRSRRDIRRRRSPIAASGRLRALFQGHFDATVAHPEDRAIAPHASVIPRLPASLEVRRNLACCTPCLSCDTLCVPARRSGSPPRAAESKR
jgi:hypothetical protein